MSILESEKIRDLLDRAGLGTLRPRTLRAVLVLAAIVAGFALWRFWPTAAAPEVAFEAEQDADPTAKPGESAEATSASPPVIVHVAGAVMRPGVYALAAGSRVVDAIAAAGGGLGSAALDNLNLARIVSDGEQVYVHTVEQANGGAAGPSAGQAGAGGSRGAGGGGSTSGVVNINTATASELESLPGVGPATAQKIVEDRETNGPFASPEDLMRVPGIGPKKFEAMREQVTCR